MTENEYNNVVLYIQKKLLEKQGFLESVDKNNIKDLQNIAKYSEYKEAKKPRSKKVVDSKQFEELWQAFPGKASFEYKGKKFFSEQAKKGNYQLCKDKYQKILDEGRYTHEQILKAMLVEVETRKIESYKTSKNVLHYMNGLQPWLNGQKFEVYIGEEMPEEIVQNKITVDTIDI